MSSMGLHRGVPGRHHRRPIPHFWRFAVAYREHKEKRSRRILLSPQEIREQKRRESSRRQQFMSLVAKPQRGEHERLTLVDLPGVLTEHGDYCEPS